MAYHRSHIQIHTNTFEMKDAHHCHMPVKLALGYRTRGKHDSPPRFRKEENAHHAR